MGSMKAKLLTRKQAADLLHVSTRTLARWQREHSTGELTLWYFGKDPLVHQLPMRPFRVQVQAVQTEEEFQDRLQGQTVAVSTTLVYGTKMPPSVEKFREWLRARPPRARTSTFLIYDFREDPSVARK